MRSAGLTTSLLLVLTASTSAISLSGQGAATHRPGPVLGEVGAPGGEFADGRIPPMDSWELSTSPNPTNVLEKRRGGGRGGGGGGGGGGSGGGKSSGGGGGRSSGAGGSGSIAGGRTTTGSGTPKSGGYYGGGGAVPFTSGGRSASGMLPAVLALSAASLFFAGAWMYGSLYAYHFDRDINYLNRTSNRNESLPVLCLCQEYSVCGCDENHNQTYVDALVANATNTTTDGSVRSKIAEVNGTRTLLINGTLDNGTTADGGTEVVSGAMGQSAGLLTLVIVVAVGVFFT